MIIALLDKEAAECFPCLFPYVANDILNEHFDFACAKDVSIRALAEKSFEEFLGFLLGLWSTTGSEDNFLAAPKQKLFCVSMDNAQVSGGPHAGV